MRSQQNLPGQSDVSKERLQVAVCGSLSAFLVQHSLSFQSKHFLFEIFSLSHRQQKWQIFWTQVWLQRGRKQIKCWREALWAQQREHSLIVCAAAVSRHMCKWLRVRNESRNSHRFVGGATADNQKLRCGERGVMGGKRKAVSESWGTEWMEEEEKTYIRRCDEQVQRRRGGPADRGPWSRERCLCLIWRLFPLPNERGFGRLRGSSCDQGRADSSFQPVRGLQSWLQSRGKEGGMERGAEKKKAKESRCRSSDHCFKSPCIHSCSYSLF